MSSSTLRAGRCSRASRRRLTRWRRSPEAIDDRPDCRRWVVPAEGGVVDDPALVAVVGPIEGEVLAELGEVVGDGVEGGAVAGPTEGDVGQLSAAAGGEDVGAVVGGALGSVDGEGVAVVEVRGVDRLAGQDDRPAPGP